MPHISQGKRYWQYRAYDSGMTIREGVLESQDFTNAMLILRQRGLQAMSLVQINAEQFLALQRLAALKKVTREDDFRVENAVPSESRIRRMARSLHFLITQMPKYIARCMSGRNRRLLRQRCEPSVK